ALTLEFPPLLSDEERRVWLEWLLRWQQFTGPVTAKGVEDTTFYVYNRLISLNEVGADPESELAPLSVDELHDRLQRRQAGWPHTMNAGSTHDTKRSEDVRPRISLLSQVPTAWARALDEWSALNRGKRREVEGVVVPDPNEEIFIYQTLVGAWPLSGDEVGEFRERLKRYMVKAAREAKAHTSWIRPDEAHEAALLAFIDDLFDDAAFLERFHALQEPIAFWGAFEALGQTLVRVAAPGLPDLYRGTELWDLSLADPDNRRPVDFDARVAALDDLDRRAEADRAGLLADLLAGWRDGRVKLYLISRALRLRRERADLFAEGDYLPLEATGARPGHVVAFARRHDGAWALAVAPRLLARLTDPGVPPLGETVWGDTALALPP
ncbi:MAG: malto-oligosyltrehalose synthase, partial [Thermomicrobiaceae bacterium]|nr:malto-oligosyltrehalose synthase [Thermomicrobiaceae bacterium]